MEKDRSYFQDSVEKYQSARILEVRDGMKQLAFIVEMKSDGNKFECLYRFEKGLLLELDPRIPKPQELYRDVVYHRIDRALGWNLTAPVIPWSLNKDCNGVLRPYWRNAGTMEIYQVDKNAIDNIEFWTKAAVLDYICGIVDRQPNDILILEDRLVLVDSGLSFVSGIDFVYHRSFIREKFQGVKLSTDIVSDLTSLLNNGIVQDASQFINESQQTWMLQRAKRVVNENLVL